jgi:hypothetical protein
LTHADDAVAIGRVDCDTIRFRAASGSRRGWKRRRQTRLHPNAALEWL